MRAALTRRDLLRGGAAIAVGAGAAELLVACAAPTTASPTPVAASSSPSTSPTMAEVSVAATDTTFDAPSTLSAGIVRVSLDNKGGVPSSLVFMRVRPGRTFDEVKAAVPRLPAFAPLVEFYGGCNGVPPGERRRVVLDLAAGTYALWSRATAVVPAPGIVRQLTVSEGSGATAPEPAADVAVSLKDGVGPVVPATVRATTTWKVTNDGQLPHVFTIWRLKPGKTAADLATFFSTGGSNPPPADGLAGTNLLSPGKRAWFTSDFAPGEYLDACNFPGRNPPATHIDEGETAKIVVG